MQSAEGVLHMQQQQLQVHLLQIPSIQVVTLYSCVGSLHSLPLSCISQRNCSRLHCCCLCLCFCPNALAPACRPHTSEAS